MTTITDTEIKQKGLGALIEALGEVDAERFIMLLNREPFDYTRWQRDNFNGMNVREFSKRAMNVRKDNPGTSELDINAH
jgi:hypothetical protein